MASIGIRCNHNRTKRNGGARSKDHGFTHYLAPFSFPPRSSVRCGNDHASAREVYLSVGLSTRSTKDASGVSAVQHSHRRRDTAGAQRELESMILSCSVIRA